MTEIRVHGRGGMGAVTLVELLAKAAGLDGKYSQAFPAFGPERRGAPVKAFCRISDTPITTRAQIYNPDYIVVLDPSLLNLPDVSGRLKQESTIMVNSNKEIKAAGQQKIQAFDATKIAMEVLGRPIVNTAMLGAFARMTGLVTLESVRKVVEERFPAKTGEINRKLAEEAYNKFGGNE